MGPEVAGASIAMSAVQVPPEHYDSSGYQSAERFYSSKCQIDAILKTSPKTVLEIGIGNGFVGKYIAATGIQVVTCDIDEKLKPTVCADVRSLPFPDGGFDVVSCCEVLEHMPVEDLPKAMREISRTSRAYVVISVPDRSPYLL